MNLNKIQTTELHKDTSDLSYNKTLVSTKDGYKNIEDIATGDDVLTYNNRYKQVVATTKRKSEGIYKLRVMGSPKTYATKGQLFYVIEKSRKWNNNKRKYDSTYSKPKWVTSEELDKKKHLIGYSQDEDNDNPLNITTEEAYIIGRYVADGHIQDNKRRGRKNSYEARVVFSIGNGKLEKFLSNINSYHVGYSKEGNVFKSYIIGQRMKNLCNLFGRGAANKRIDGAIFRSNIGIQKHFLRGYLDGDGSYNGKIHKATTVSKELVYGLGRLVQNTLKLPYSIVFTKRPEKTIIEGRVVNQKDTWTIEFRKEAKIRQSISLYNKIWNPIREIVYDSSFQGHTYSIEVDEDNSYAINNMTTRSC